MRLLGNGIKIIPMVIAKKQPIFTAKNIKMTLGIEQKEWYNLLSIKERTV